MGRDIQKAAHQHLLHRTGFQPPMTVNLDKAMQNPASEFATPEAVCDSTELTAKQKRAVLSQWKDQLQQLQAADDEGMQDSEGAPDAASAVLGRVTSLLSRIEADSDRTARR